MLIINKLQVSEEQLPQKILNKQPTLNLFLKLVMEMILLMVNLILGMN